MQTEPQITFHGLDSSPAMRALALEHLGKLERQSGRITSARVTIEKRTAQGRKGHLFRVAVELEVPGGVVVVNRKPGDVDAHESLRVAMRDSFNAARRQLADHFRKRKDAEERPQAD